jgi:hypothetical protein
MIHRGNQEKSSRDQFFKRILSDGSNQEMICLLGKREEPEISLRKRKAKMQNFFRPKKTFLNQYQ